MRGYWRWCDMLEHLYSQSGIAGEHLDGLWNSPSEGIGAIEEYSRSPAQVLDRYDSDPN